MENRILKSWLGLGAGIGLLTGEGMAGNGYGFEEIQIPGKTGVVATDISEDGTVLGYHAEGVEGDLTSFLLNGSVATALPKPAGFNSMQASGMNASGVVVGQLDTVQGYLFQGGQFTLPVHPEVGVNEWLLSGINSAGVAVGTAFDDVSAFGFTLSGTNFNRIQIPGASRSFASGINARGLIVGQYRAGSGATYGYHVRGTNPPVSLAFPGADRTIAYGVNDDDVIVGAYRLPGGTAFKGFVYETGVYTAIDYPGSAWTVPLGINNRGAIVGYFRDATNGLHAFRAERPRIAVWRYRAMTIDVPGAKSTLAEGINRWGEIALNGSGSVAGAGVWIRDAGGAFERQPLPPGETSLTVAAINDDRVMTGQLYPVGYVQKGTNFTIFEVPESTENLPRAINGSRAVVGDAYGDFGTFAFSTTNGVGPAPLVLAGSSTGGLGINDRGAVVGYRQLTSIVDSTTNSFVVGFLQDPVDGLDGLVRFPGAQYTSYDSIDNRGQILGSYIRRTVGSGLFHFLRTPEGEWVDVTVDVGVPGARRPTVTGMNGSGLLVGYYRAPNASNELVYHGFLAQREDATLEDVHSDIGFDFSLEEGWNPHVHNHGSDTEFKPWEAILQVNPGAKGRIPADPSFAFLGKAGDPVWVLPQGEKPGLLYLGFGAETVADGVFQGDRFDVVMKGCRGPGQFAAYLIDGFGRPTVFLNSADGIDGSDVYPVTAGSHVHMNFSFTAPGIYVVTLEARGVLMDGQPTSPGPRDYTFVVLSPEVPADALDVVGHEDGNLLLRVLGQQGVGYRLQRRALATSGEWLAEGGPLIGTGLAQEVRVSLSGEASYFRLVLDQP